jgi:hypothetical protein
MPVMTTPRKPRKDGGRKPRRAGVPLNVWLPRELRKALDALLVRTRRPLTTEVVIALEKHLEEAGLWPPAEGEEVEG